jgi:hypothetical protein
MKRLFGGPNRPAPAVEELNQDRLVSSPRRKQPIELGSIDYVNLTPDGRHGDMDRALAVAGETGKPIFANFVEWSG